ncbi:DUF190 domain-containing protein [Compostibacter hankyongensis]|uniref:DUF190 domain-containing protein n=1 Tax=Compostibacter hankyongensis TaxID=1007089 RepID=A0ABP8FS58_9BACT
MEMQPDGTSTLLRIFIGESDKSSHSPLYEALLFEAKKAGMAGATVLRGIMSYGASTRVHTAKLIDISQDLPIIVEIVDREEKIQDFVATVHRLMDEAGCGGLVTLEKIRVLYYQGRKE